MTWAIQIQNVSKVFSTERRQPTFYTFIKRILHQKFMRPNLFYALKYIEFEIQQGEKIGLIGNNGSGKSTLLKVISRLYRPDEGVVRTNGEMLLLTGLGTGMLDELSLEENIILYGSIYGLERTAIRVVIPEILEWAELKKFANAKLKTLSSGMRSRLAFSMMRYLAADIVLLDEALTAGDRNFKVKCQATFDDYKKTSRTFLIATHDLSFVERFCSKTIWLHMGHQMAFDYTDRVLQEYSDATLR